MALKDLRRLQRHNLTTLRRRPLPELSGALGDLGTLLPLMIALALQRSVSLPSTLVFSGLFNILTGALFGVPLPVQPMKAIAAAAIAADPPASQSQTLAAGALVGAAVGVLSLTGLLRWLTARVPVPVVKGIQFGAGMQLVISGGGGPLRPLGWVGPSAWDNRLWAGAAFLLLIATARTPRRFPYALIVFVVGLVLAIVAVAVDKDNNDGGGDKKHHHLPTFEIWRPFTMVPAFADPQAWSMAVAQLPLTTLNSVIAAAALAAELMGKQGPGHPQQQQQTTKEDDEDLEVSFPATASTPTVTELGLSVAAMNLLGCWFGAMPVCHGAGGLAAQYRFGARSGASIVVLGACKLVLGLFLGATLLDLLGSFPRGVLGVMVVAAGLELAKVGQSLNYGASDLWEDSVSSSSTSPSPAAGASSSSGGENSGGDGVSSDVPQQRQLPSTRRHRDISDEERAERWTVMLMTAAGILAFKNDAVGFVAGMLTFWAYGLSHALERRQRRRRHDVGRGERQPLLRWP